MACATDIETFIERKLNEISNLEAEIVKLKAEIAKKAKADLWSTRLENLCSVFHRNTGLPAPCHIGFSDIDGSAVLIWEQGNGSAVVVECRNLHIFDHACHTFIVSYRLQQKSDLFKAFTSRVQGSGAWMLLQQEIAHRIDWLAKNLDEHGNPINNDVLVAEVARLS
jgi:hypothetical protein